MGNYTDKAFITSQQGRRYKGQTMILHAAIGKGTRQYQQTISAPGIGCQELFPDCNEIFRLIEFPSTAIQLHEH